tara:strand:+ start:3822 stop:5717 length:1896 start_codon:yes stop_codon:yes gene_type:complete
MIQYRKEIDGLRAIAVIPVILFHAGLPAFSGGFIGVDVFFVISGYLITSIILSEKQTGTFSLVCFYERRARRILPALFLVIFVCLPLAWLLMLPSELKNFSRSLISVPLFISNISFWKDSGYFTATAELKPLLHTWSLAVEEQYYLLFPIFLALTWKWGRRCIISILAIISVTSLCAAIWGSINKPTAAFFLLPSRGWELLIGVFVAFFLFNNKINVSMKISQAISLIGILLITYSVFIFDKNTPFPSFYALIPTLGTALVILYANPKTLVGKLLSNKLLVGIGLISYSAYLWHQPLFAFARLYIINPISSSYFLVLSICSLVLAYFSWKYVERPFRNNKIIGRKYIFIYAISISILIVALGLFTHKKNGFIDRLSAEQQQIASYNQYDYATIYRKNECFLDITQTFKEFSVSCKKVVENSNTLLIWGDSHAAALSSGLRKKTPNLIQYTAANCPPMINMFLDFKSRCEDINNFILQEVKKIKPNIILLHANWYIKPQIQDTHIIKTINRINKISPLSKVYIIGGTPQWYPNLPLHLIRREVSQDKETYITVSAFNDLKTTDEKLHLASNVTNAASFLSVLEMLCNGSMCQAVVETNHGFEPVVFDYGHLTNAGATLIAEKIMTQLNSDIK